MALKSTKLVGKSRTAIYERNGWQPITKWVELVPTQNDTFILPNQVELTGRWLVANPSAVAQAAVTIGTSAAGTQISAGASVGAAASSGIVAGTRLAPQYTGGVRTIYVESAAWQKGVKVLIEAVELPMLRDTTAKS